MCSDIVVVMLSTLGIGAIGRVLSLLHIWLIVKDSINILIIHLGLLLKKSTIDSVGHAF